MLNRFYSFPDDIRTIRFYNILKDMGIECIMTKNGAVQVCPRSDRDITKIQNIINFEGSGEILCMVGFIRKE